MGARDIITAAVGASDRDCDDCMAATSDEACDACTEESNRAWRFRNTFSPEHVALMEAVVEADAIHRAMSSQEVGRARTFSAHEWGAIQQRGHQAARALAAYRTERAL